VAVKKSMRIAFNHGGIIPGSVLKAKKDKSVAPHEEVTVPVAYGKHLCDDKFAYEVVGKKASAEEAAAEKAAAEKAAAEKAAAEKAAAEKAEQIVAAQANLVSAQEALDGAEDQKAKDAAQEKVSEAQGALNALEDK